MLPVLLIALCIVFRVLPHPPNFAPVGATAVFSGRVLPTWLALPLVGVAMFAGDVLLARLHGYPIANGVTPFVYSGFAVQALLGRWLRSRVGGSIAAALSGSLVFFAISNFGVWLTSGMYPHTAGGISACYVAALPFLGATVLGDLAWTAVLCGTYRLAAARLDGRRSWVPVPIRETAVV